MENSQPQTIQPVNPQEEIKPVHKKSKIFLFLFLFLVVDLILGIVYFYISGKINPKILLSKFTPNTVTPETINLKKGNEIKILSLTYIPLDNKNLDLNVIDNSSGVYSNLTPDDIKHNVDNMNVELAKDLENGTKYHYYKDNKAQPAIKYSFYNKIQKFSSLPFSGKFFGGNPEIRVIDYNTIMQESDICNLVDNKGVNEVWIWVYASNNVKGWDTNMSSSFYDVSSSDKDSTDLPICNHSYTVYLYDYGKGIDEALSKHIKQFESVFTTLNKDLFWYKYVGYFSNSKWEGNWGDPLILDHKRRCGSDFFPPNGTDFNDWLNTDSMQSDCMNWDPNGKGNWEDINCNMWKCTRSGFYIFWMQNIPGPDNNLTYNGAKLRNWWDFISNFDDAMKVKQDLVY